MRYLCGAALAPTLSQTIRCRPREWCSRDSHKTGKPPESAEQAQDHSEALADPSASIARGARFDQTSVTHQLRDGKSFVTWAEAVLRSSSVRRSLRLHHSMSTSGLALSRMRSSPSGALISCGEVVVGGSFATRIEGLHTHGQKTFDRDHLRGDDKLRREREIAVHIGLAAA